MNHHGRNNVTASAGKRALLFVLLIAQLMVILDITAVNIALPSLAKDLQLTGSDISWTITSYSLIFGSLLLLGGRAADLLGRRRMFLAGLGIFTASSLASATAGSAATLFAARAGQIHFDQLPAIRRDEDQCRVNRSLSQPETDELSRLKRELIGVRFAAGYLSLDGLAGFESLRFLCSVRRDAEPQAANYQHKRNPFPHRLSPVAD